MNNRLIETIQKNKNKIKDGAYIDVYNRAIRDDGICGTILVGVDFRNNSFIVVKEEKYERDRADFMGGGIK